MASKTIVVPSDGAGMQPSSATLLASIAELKEEVANLKSKQKLQMALLIVVIVATTSTILAMHVL